VTLKVEAIRTDNVDDEIVCCVGTAKSKDPTPWFAKGIQYKRNWLKEQLDKYGEVGKIAYKDGKPVGFFEYVPGSAAPLVFPDRDQCVYAICYDVVTEERGKGVGSVLVRSILKEFSRPHPWFNNKPAESLKLIAFEKSEWKPVKPFHEMKFKTQIRWLYSSSEHVPIPALLTYDIEAKERETRTIEVQLPMQRHLPFPVRVFRSVVCPWLPDFSGAKRVADKFGNQVRFEIFDLWKNPRLTEIYGPVPGTVVNNQQVWSSPVDYEKELERTIHENIKKLLNLSK
jgi:GNAT superfamily N-acetyltransferase